MAVVFTGKKIYQSIGHCTKKSISMGCKAMTNIVPSAQLNLDQTMTDIAGQISETSQRIYTSDTEHFARWILAHNLTPATFQRSDMIAYRSYLDTVLST